MSWGRRASDILRVLGRSAENLGGVGRESEKGEMELHVENGVIFGRSSTGWLSGKENGDGWLFRKEVDYTDEEQIAMLARGIDGLYTQNSSRPKLFGVP